MEQLLHASVKDGFLLSLSARTVLPEVIPANNFCLSSAQLIFTC